MERGILDGWTRNVGLLFDYELIDVELNMIPEGYVSLDCHRQMVQLAERNVCNVWFSIMESVSQFKAVYY